MALPDDLWREAAAWLTRCKIIPSDPRFKGARISDILQPAQKNSSYIILLSTNSSPETDDILNTTSKNLASALQIGQFRSVQRMSRPKN